MKGVGKLVKATSWFDIESDHDDIDASMEEGFEYSVNPYKYFGRFTNHENLPDRG
jgi:hypothetical protein